MARQPRGRDGKSKRPRRARADRRAVQLLWLLVGLGVLLRILLTVAQHPGYIASTDAFYYLIAAHTNIFLVAAQPDAYPWPAGYPLFLATLYKINESISFVVLVQHMLGVGTAVLWFFTVRRAVSAIWGLLPAAVILFAGPALFLEHAPIAETLFAFLIAAAAYSAVRAAETGALPWMAAAGGLAASAACTRVVGVPLALLLAAWMLVGITSSPRERVIGACTVILAAGLVFGTYLGVMKYETGYGGPALTRSGTWSGPAGGTGRFEHTPYLERVARDLTRFWGSDDRGARGGYSYEGLVGLIDDRIAYSDFTQNYTDLTGTERPGTPARWYSTDRATGAAGLDKAFHTYERLTRIQNVSFVALVLLSVCGLALARGRELAVAFLLGAIAALLLLGPVALVYFDARYVVPAYGPLAATAAIGAAALWRRVAVPRRERRHPSPSAKRAKGRARPRTATPSGTTA